MRSARTDSGYKDLPYPVATSTGASATMRANRRTDTKPEVLVRSLLHRRGHRFRKDLPIRVASAAVRPDIVFSKRKLAVFIDGCFWHRCPEHGITPASNRQYWAPKLARNVDRDRRDDAELTKAGWRTLRIWEHVSPKDAVAHVEMALTRCESS